MSSGDVTDRVDHDHDHQPPHDAYSGECNGALAQIHRHRGTAGEDHEVGRKRFSDDLRTYLGGKRQARAHE